MGRPRTTPVGNPALAAAIAGTGLSYASIAQVINRVAAESGTPASCTAGSLGKWLNGALPQPGTMPLAVEAFSRLLGQSELTAAGLGWPGPATAPGDPWRGDPVAWITRLGRDDMLDRRTALAAGLYSLAAALPAIPQQMATRTGPARRAGPSDVARIRRMGDQFQEMDDLYGGSHGRTTVAAYLVHEVAPLLRGTTGSARPGLFTAAAEITYLLAWMTADDRRPGLAQRYYIQAARPAGPAARAHPRRGRRRHPCRSLRGRAPRRAGLHPQGRPARHLRAVDEREQTCCTGGSSDSGEGRQARSNPDAHGRLRGGRGRIRERRALRLGQHPDGHRQEHRRLVLLGRRGSQPEVPHDVELGVPLGEKLPVGLRVVGEDLLLFRQPLVVVRELPGRY